MAGRIAAFILGGLFGAGLIIGGMTQPTKVIGFLDVFGDWDPSLLFVMAGAVLVYVATFRWFSNRPTPVLGASFAIPKRTDIDGRLLVGSALFGVGWGLAGLCPGPAVVSAGGLGTEALVFTACMFVGFYIQRRIAPSK